MIQALIDTLAATPPRFPLMFLGGFAEMDGAFRAIACQQGLPPLYSARIADLLPSAIRCLPCFLDMLSGVWRYDYGDPITFPDGRINVGTHMFQEVACLFEVVSCAEWRLRNTEGLGAYLTRLANRSHHEDTLVEFAPILNLDRTTSVDYEVRSRESGNNTVDWSIRAVGQPKLLLEVKNRDLDLIESLEARKYMAHDEAMRAPSHDHSRLFRSVERKFEPHKSDEAIQGVWIRTALRQEEAELETAFKALPEGIHVAVLGSWSDEAHILARDGETKRRVRKILRVRSGKGLTFRRQQRV
jgi:hypothetical protein